MLQQIKIMPLVRSAMIGLSMSLLLWLILLIYGSIQLQQHYNPEHHTSYTVKALKLPLTTLTKYENQKSTTATISLESGFGWYLGFGLLAGISGFYAYRRNGQFPSNNK